MIVEYADLKLDLSTAYALLENELELLQAWEIHMQLELGDYEGALRHLLTIAAERSATHVSAMLKAVSERAGLTDDFG